LGKFIWTEAKEGDDGSLREERFFTALRSVPFDFAQHERDDDGSAALATGLRRIVN